MNKEINWNGIDCIVEIYQYNADHRKSITLIEKGTGEPVAEATVNLDLENLPKNHVYIKEWSENKGITKVLEDAGVITWKNVKVEINDFGSYANICEILI